MSQIGNLPHIVNRGENKKYLKPPTSKLMGLYTTINGMKAVFSTSTASPGNKSLASHLPQAYCDLQLLKQRSVWTVADLFFMVTYCKTIWAKAGLHNFAISAITCVTHIAISSKQIFALYCVSLQFAEG